MPRKLFFVLLLAAFVFTISPAVPTQAKPKWVDFNIPAWAMAKAMDYDIRSYGEETQIDWIALLAMSGARSGGSWESIKAADIESDAKRLADGESPSDILDGYKSYEHYYFAYNSVLGGFLGEHLREVPCKENPGAANLVEKYGLKAYSPVAEGYGYSHHKDFGNSRSYGYRRKHFGNDLMGSVGTPIIAVEGGVIEELGWNRYGGWRVGIRSHDSLRYYYYAHLRKDHPWPKHLEIGMNVQGGDVVGYLGMTGYSIKENVNGMRIPHLHFGMQLVFEGRERDDTVQNWIDVYEIVELLEQNRASVVRCGESGEQERKYRLFDYYYASGD